MNAQRSAVWNESCEPYALAWLERPLYPFTLSCLRWSRELRLIIPTAGMAAAKKQLMPGQFLEELERAHWLLTSSPEQIAAHLREGSHAGEIQPSSLSLQPSERGAFTRELNRILQLVEASLFTSEPRDESTDSDIEDGQIPPDDRYPPDDEASLIFGLARELKLTPYDIQHRMPACQVIQLLHCMQWGNRQIWTLPPDLSPTEKPKDPLKAIAIQPDEGYGEKVEF